MARKTKTYVLMLSKNFPAFHPKAGNPTGFQNKLQAALNGNILQADMRKSHPLDLIEKQ